MKKLVLSTALVFAVTLAFAQEDDRRGFLAISLGAAVPFGDFASTQTDNDDAGFALTGGNVNLSFGYKLGETLGLMAMLNGGSNPLNTDALEDEFRSNFSQASWSVKSDPWSYGTLMLGGFASFPTSSRSSFDVRLLLGVLRSTTPQIDATASIAGVSTTATRESKSVTTGAFDVGFVYRYRITDPLCILVSADFLTANPRFENVQTRSVLGTRTDNFDQNLRVINLNLGVAFLLK
jgi:hypothetical protein